VRRNYDVMSISTLIGSFFARCALIGRMTSRDVSCAATCCTLCEVTLSQGRYGGVYILIRASFAFAFLFPFKLISLNNCVYPSYLNHLVCAIVTTITVVFLKNIYKSGVVLHTYVVCDVSRCHHSPTNDVIDLQRRVKACYAQANATLLKGGQRL
jgi:hypothetical protein